MKPIAVVHWQQNGDNKIKECFDQEQLNRMTRILKDGNYVFVTCICSFKANVPFVGSRKVREAI